jgi:hypothetical protein
MKCDLKVCFFSYWERLLHCLVVPLLTFLTIRIIRHNLQYGIPFTSFDIKKQRFGSHSSGWTLHVTCKNMSCIQKGPHNNRNFRRNLLRRWKDTVGTAILLDVAFLCRRLVSVDLPLPHTSTATADRWIKSTRSLSQCVQGMPKHQKFSSTSFSKTLPLCSS